MTDPSNRRAADEQPITGREPSLRRLYDQLENIRQAEETAEEEREQVEQLQAQIAALMEQVNSLENQVQSFTRSRYEKSGFVYDVHPRAHSRAHPEIIKTSECMRCGSTFSYEVYATGWTRRLCETCKPAHRREYMRAYQRRRRAEQQTMNLENTVTDRGDDD